MSHSYTQSAPRIFFLWGSGGIGILRCQFEQISLLERKWDSAGCEEGKERGRGEEVGGGGGRGAGWGGGGGGGEEAGK